MTELILHVNNYSITRAITAYQTYFKFFSEGLNSFNERMKKKKILWTKKMNGFYKTEWKPQMP